MMLKKRSMLLGYYSLILELKNNEPVKRKSLKEKDLLRTNRKAILLNNRELGALDYYCKKYRIHNQSKFIREAIMREILRKFEDDHPKLFESEQLTLF